MEVAVEQNNAVGAVVQCRNRVHESTVVLEVLQRGEEPVPAEGWEGGRYVKEHLYRAPGAGIGREACGASQSIHDDDVTAE
eukprot:6040137-Pyramimonas_sp.AAC.1